MPLFDLPTEEVVTVIALPILGALGQHLWTRYRNRLAELRWTATYTPMAFATEDFGWGRVEIKYDGHPTKNLHVVKVQLQNASSRDLSDLALGFFADTGTRVLRAGGQLRGAVEPFMFTDKHVADLDSVVQGRIVGPLVDLVLQRAAFRVPVLNRSGVAEFQLLTSREDHQQPVISVVLNHVGARLTHQPLAPETLGVRQAQAALVALFTAGFIITGLVLAGIGTVPLGIVSWFLGAFGLYVGAVVVRFTRGILRAFD